MKKRLLQTGIVSVAFVSLFACKKDKVACPVVWNIVGPIPYLYFNIVDEPTNQNLFLSSNSKYDTSQLRMFVRVDSSGTILIKRFPFGIDSTRHCLFIPPFHDTIFMNIADLPQDTLLTKSSNSIPAGPCNYFYFIDSVKFDNQIYVAADKQIITLKK